MEFSTVLERATAGDANAQNLLGAMYQTGSSVTRDVAEAAKWYSKAADQGHAAAQANLGAMYMLGTGVRQDNKKGVELIKLSAAQKLPLGIARLGAAYLQGWGIEQDIEKGTRLLLQAVESGVGLAAFELGRAHLHGNGATKDAQQARTWFLRSAELGYPSGQYVYARDYEKDVGKKVELFRRAANGGHAGAQYSFGQILADKSSGLYDLDKAIYWFTLAALNGNQMGNQARMRLGLTDVNGKWPAHPKTTSSGPTKPLDGHTTVVMFAAAAAIAILLTTTSSNGSEATGSSPPERRQYCDPCNYGEAETHSNMCINLTTGALRMRYCRDQ